jgi:hypothetical protein
MHLLGTNIKAYAYKPGADTIKFVNVPKWDFMWQDFYFFKFMQKVPQGYKLKSEGTYDNTANNPNNPNSPPQTVFSGFNTTDEMFLTYFHYLPYQPGDETYDLEALISASLNEYPIQDNSSIIAYPNPFNEQLTLSFPKSFGANDLLYFYNASGQLQFKITPEQGGTALQLGTEHPEWQALPKGVYFLSARLSGQLFSKKLIKF